MPDPRNRLARATAPARAWSRATVFFLKLFPMLPSRPVDWVTPQPVVEKVCYPTCAGFAEGDLYRPATPGPHPGIVVCLGVVPFGVEHPQVARLGKALARAGIAGMMYWSPAMRDFRLDPADIENIPLAYDWLVRQPGIDTARSGMFGTCVGGAFTLMAAAHPLIRDRVAYLGTYAPFSSMWTFARDIASASRCVGEQRLPWKVDPLTRKVFVHSITDCLDEREAAALRDAFEASDFKPFDPARLSAEGQAVYRLLTLPDAATAEALLKQLPEDVQHRLTAMSPVNYLPDLRAPQVTVLHDRGDQVIPVGESQRLIAALCGRPGVHYTEMQFSHLDPIKGRLPLPKLARELGKFLMAMYTIFEKIEG